MTIFQAVILGIVQGLTEFLPISSSGHLVIFQRLFGLKEPELFFDVSVHMGTLAAVVIFYRKDIRRLCVAFFTGIMQFRSNNFPEPADKADFQTAVLIIVGSVPTAIIGLLFRNVSGSLFTSILLVGFAMIATGAAMWSERFIPVRESIPLTGKKALLIGTVQGIAIIPGVSRSGSTIVTGLFMGLNRESAAKFSFLLSIPAIIGAEILSLSHIGAHSNFAAALFGTLTAGIVGFFALRFLVYIVKIGRLHYFSIYCWLIGAGLVIWGLT